MLKSFASNSHIMNCMRLFVGFVQFEHGGTILPVSRDGSSLRNMKNQANIHKAREKLKSF